MFGVRIHGHRGQGVATTAELLAMAAVNRGRHAQVFSGEEPRAAGAGVVAGCRISEAPVRGRPRLARPDAVILEDPAFLYDDAALAGLSPESYLLVNSSAGLGELGCEDRLAGLCRNRMLVLPATRIAVWRLGRPLPGSPLLGGLAALTGVVGVEDLVSAGRARFADRLALAEGNAAAVRAGYAFIAAEREALSAV